MDQAAGKIPCSLFPVCFTYFSSKTNILKLGEVFADGKRPTGEETAGKRTRET